MGSKTWNASRWRIAYLISVSAITFLLLVLPAAPQAKPTATPPTQKTYPTPEDAAKSLIEAAQDFDKQALIEILGPDSQDLVASEDPVEDRIRATAFVAAARDKNGVKIDTQKGRAELLVGKEDWPLPIPIVKRNGRWQYDAKAGRTEILARRIGENELNAIRICRGFVEAQLEYASEKHDNSTVNQYAHRIISTPGMQDGLAWQNPNGSWGGPVGDAAAKALEKGYAQGEPYYGYYFKVLNGQGPAARMGEENYFINGVMIGGFALTATPAQYRVTGVQTFMVNHDGIVYQKDLGVDSLSIFKAMDRFNPDKTWHRTDDEP